MMPLLDGFTLLQKIRSHPQFGYLPVVFLTALTADDERLKALRLGVDAYLSKPFAEEELLTRLAHLVLRQQDRKQYVKELATRAAISGETIEEEVETYDETWMNELARVVHENFHDPDFKVPDIAFLLNVSERTLFNKLKQYTGQTPSLYLRKVRLDHAYNYLKTRKYQTIKEVVYATGFSNPRYFTMLFKEEFGITPAQAKWKLPR
jgi:YesN/AraC family two-component response regulator